MNYEFSLDCMLVARLKIFSFAAVDILLLYFLKQTPHSLNGYRAEMPFNDSVSYRYYYSVRKILHF